MEKPLIHNGYYDKWAPGLGTFDKKNICLNLPGIKSRYLGHPTCRPASRESLKDSLSVKL
jgi:hypothetical protein